MKEKVEKYGIEKPELKPLEYTYNKKSSLSPSEQMTAITLRNTAVLYKKMIDQYGDRQVEFNGEKINLSELTFYYYNASKDRDTIKTIAKQMTKAGAEALAGAGVKADNASSVSSSKSSKASVNTISSISIPNTAPMTRSMDYDYDNDGGVHWGSDDNPNDDWGAPGWTDDIVVSADNRGEIEYDPLDEPDMDFGLGLQDAFETQEQNDIWDAYFDNYDQFVGNSTAIGSTIGSYQKFAKIGIVSNMVSCASAAAKIISQGVNADTMFNGASSVVGCMGGWGTAVSIVANAYKDGINWFASEVSSFQAQLEKCFSTPSWVAAFQMGF